MAAFALSLSVGVYVFRMDENELLPVFALTTLMFDLKAISYFTVMPLSDPQKALCVFHNINAAEGLAPTTAVKLLCMTILLRRKMYKHFHEEYIVSLA